MINFDVVVLGSGPAGLAAAIESSKLGVETLLIEREKHLGGILKQCIHEGFGLFEFKEKLTGTEYAARFLNALKDTAVKILTQAFTTHIEKRKNHFVLTVQTSQGIFQICAKSVVFSTGCRERTSRQVFVHGERPSGIFTAGAVQNYVNLMGYLPTKKCVILGSGDIGLIISRRLTIEGAKVEGVFEIKPEPSGLTRNIVQCLDAFQIPLYLSHTVKRVIGRDRTEAVEIVKVNEEGKILENTSKIVKCDALIIAAGLIPENEVIKQLNVVIDEKTNGPIIDQNCMSMVEGIFACGNNVYVSDQVDFVTQLGRIAGRSAALYSLGKLKRGRLIQLKHDETIAFVVPQIIDVSSKIVRLYFRPKRAVRNAKISIIGSQVLAENIYPLLRPQQTEVLEFEIKETAPSLLVTMTGDEEKVFTTLGERKMICGICPKGCEISVVKTGENYDLYGYRCQKGYDFVVKNLSDPHQVLTTTVRTACHEQPLLAVKTVKPVPIRSFQKIMEEVKSIVVREPVNVGQAIRRNVGGTGVDLVSTFFLNFEGGMGNERRSSLGYRLWNPKLESHAF